MARARTAHPGGRFGGCRLGFLGNMLAGTFAPAEFPRMAALAERANRMPAFAETHPRLDS